MLSEPRGSGERFCDLRVLVVDDSTSMRRLIEGMLKRYGIRNVTSARDGRSAIEVFGSEPASFDLIICDWKMPEMSGLEVLRAIRQIEPSVAFVMVTGYSEADGVLKAIELGVSGYVKKPFSSHELESRIRAAVAGKVQPPISQGKQQAIRLSG